MPLTDNVVLFQAIHVFLFGLIIGSFLNVCIYRIPQKISLMGRSFCPKCQKPIPIYRNVPIFSYAIQFGKSACCKQRISIQYPMVELVTGLLALATFFRVNSWLEFFMWFLLFVAPLIIVSGIDFKLKIIPDVISIPFIFVGMLVHLYEKYPDFGGALFDSALGVFLGGGSLLVLAEVISRLKGVEAMGGGDIKLTAMLGAFLGWKPLVFIFFVSSVLALIYIVASFPFRKDKANRTIPFGPFLSLAGIIFYLYGKEITDAYFLGSGFGVNPLFP